MSANDNLPENMNEKSKTKTTKFNGDRQTRIIISRLLFYSELEKPQDNLKDTLISKT